MNPVRMLLVLIVMTVSVPLLSPYSRAGEDLRVYTLEDSIDEALANNFSLEAKAEQVRQSEHASKQAKAEFFPKFGMSYGYIRQSETTTFNLGSGVEVPISTLDNYQWKGTVTQPLFTGFALTSSYNLARLGVDRSKLELDLDRLDLVLRVKEAYYTILIADKAVEVAGSAVESLSSNVEVARNFHKVGMIPINDVLKAEVELANARQNLVKATNGSRRARFAFNTLLSRPITLGVDVVDILVYNAEQGEFTDYLERALKGRPEMSILEVSLEQVGQQIELARSAMFPKVALSYEYVREGDSMDVSGSPYHDSSAWNAGVGLTWTFWEWGKTSYAVKERESTRDELLKTKLSLEDAIRLEVKDAMLALDEAEKNIPTTSKAVEQAEENLRVNEERYKAQVTTITEVLDAQTLLTRAKSNYYTALYDHNLARARLTRALGDR